MAIYSHFRGVARAPGPDGGNILIVRLDAGWFWLIPIDAERTSVGLVTTVENFKAQKLPPAEFFQQTVNRWAKLNQLLASAAALTEFRVTTDYSYFRSELARERLILAGDAAGFFDPIFSSGVYMSMETAKQAVERIARAHRAGRALTTSEQQAYTARVKRHAAVFQKLIQAFYDDDSFEVFMSQKVPWSLSPGLTSIVAGHAKLPWPLWWRFHFFLLVCRLQKRWKIVKPEHVYAPTLAQA
jgi:2-polyprenyl-6-methoxyphenol hydroxylase-like FAD-dependent oxidoreductase